MSQVDIFGRGIVEVLLTPVERYDHTVHLFPQGLYILLHYFGLQRSDPVLAGTGGHRADPGMGRGVAEKPDPYPIQLGNVRFSRYRKIRPRSHPGDASFPQMFLGRSQRIPAEIHTVVVGQ
jgi:hypothetical protein